MMHQRWNDPKYQKAAWAVAMFCAATLALPCRAMAEEGAAAKPSSAVYKVPYFPNSAHSAALDLKIMSSYQDVPKTKQEFFSTARRELEKDPNASIAGSPAIRKAAEQANLKLLGGPMLGCLLPDGVNVWVRTIGPASVKVVLEINGTERVFGPVKSTVESDLTAVVPVIGLKASTRYKYKVLVDDIPVSMPPDAAIVTAPPSGKSGRVKIAFGCDFHKYGLHNPRLLPLIRERGNVAFLIHGDIAAQDRKNHLGLHRSDYLLRDMSEPWRNLVASVPVYALWDDHDYLFDDWNGISNCKKLGQPGYDLVFTENDRRSVRQIWMQNWNNPSYGFNDDRGGLFLRTRIGPVDIIMIDNRYFGGTDKENGEYEFLGVGQTRWLEKQLSECEGPFVMLSCGTMWSDYVSAGKDSWGTWDPKGRERLFSFIERQKIPRLILLSGDRHGARGFRIQRPSGRVFYEFNIGSLGGMWGPAGNVPNCVEQLFGFDGGIPAFSEWEFDGSQPEPTATFRLIDEYGKSLYEMMLTREHFCVEKAE